MKVRIIKLAKSDLVWGISNMIVLASFLAALFMIVVISLLLYILYHNLRRPQNITSWILIGSISIILAFLVWQSLNELNLI